MKLVQSNLHSDMPISFSECQNFFEPKFCPQKYSAGSLFQLSCALNLWHKNNLSVFNFTVAHYLKIESYSYLLFMNLRDNLSMSENFRLVNNFCNHSLAACCNKLQCFVCVANEGLLDYDLFRILFQQLKSEV